MELEYSAPVAIDAPIPWRQPLVASDRQQYLFLPPPRQRQICPAGVDLQAFVHLLSQGHLDRALLLMRSANPFPVICGRVCRHPCEQQLWREGFLQHPAIAQIKQAAANHEVSGEFMPPAPFAILHPQKIAVVGAGAEGLTVAFDLCHLGYAVTIFEKTAHSGGVLRRTIPETFLHIFQRELSLLREAGVKFCWNGKSLRWRNCKKTIN